MVEEEAKPAKKPGLSLSIQLPDDDESKQKAQASSQAQSQAPGEQSSARPQVSARATAETSGKTSARGESGRTSAREGGTRTSARPSSRTGGLSARGTKGVFAAEAQIKGNVIFGEGCIVHPGAQIFAEGGDIVFGDYNIIEEYVQIVNQPRKDASGQPVKRTMRIGNYNVFEVGCVIESSDIGDLNEFGVRCKVQQGSLVQNGCIVNPLVQVPAKSKVPSTTVYIDQGVTALDQQPREEGKKNNVKEICSILSDCMPQHLKTQVKDANGKWQQVDVQPKASGKTSARPSARAGGATSARGGQTSARGNTSQRGPTSTTSTTKAPSSSSATSTATAAAAKQPPAE